MEEAVQDFQATAPPVQPQSYPFPPSSSRRSRRLFPLIALLLLVFLLIFVAARFIGSRKGQTKVALTPSPTEVIFPTDTPVPTEVLSPTVKPTSTPTPKPTVNPVDKATGLDRSTLSVSVLNGSGTAGVAGKASDLLKALGYRVVSTGNAASFDLVTTTIDVKSAKSEFLPLLKKDLSSSYTIGTTSATLSATASADAVLTVGKQ